MYPFIPILHISIIPIIHTREFVQEIERVQVLQNEEQEQFVEARLLVLI
jgi:hypothetical protein